MKHLFNVFLLALTVVLFYFHLNGLALFVGALCVVVWFIPKVQHKTPEEYLTEANDEGTDKVLLEFEYVSNPGKIFSASLDREKCSSSADIQIALAEDVVKRTGGECTPERLNITKFIQL